MYDIHTRDLSKHRPTDNATCRFVSVPCQCSQVVWNHGWSAWRPLLRFTLLRAGQQSAQSLTAALGSLDFRVRHSSPAHVAPSAMFP